MSRKNTRLSYQPFLFGASIAGLVAKIAYSLSTQGRVLDITLCAVIIIFAVSSLLYFFELRKPSGSTELRAEVSVGDVKDSEVLGAESSKRDNTSVKIDAGKLTKARVIGYKETKN